MLVDREDGDGTRVIDVLAHESWSPKREAVALDVPDSALEHALGLEDLGPAGQVGERARRVEATSRDPVTSFRPRPPAVTHVVGS